MLAAMFIWAGCNFFDYKRNNMSTDREKGTGSKRARVTRTSRLLPLIIVASIMIYLRFN
jgi:hypothetical protein